MGVYRRVIHGKSSTRITKLYVKIRGIMKKIDVVTDNLSRIEKRHEAFKKIFNTFQENISHLQSSTFPVRGIVVENVKDDTTTIEFIGRTYEVRFSSCSVDKTFKGKISLFRIFGESDQKGVSSATYNGESFADVQPPENEDPICLSEVSCCLNLVLNWLLNDIRFNLDRPF